MKRPQNQVHNGTVKKVLIVDDVPEFRRGVAQIIANEQDLQVCGEVGSGDQGIEGTARLKPDIVLLEVKLPDRRGLEIIREIRSAHPGVKVLVVSTYDEALYANRVLRLGGDGYIMKQEEPEEVITAIHDILSGHIYVSETVLARQNRQVAKSDRGREVEALSDSQLEILELLGKGASYSEIGKTLGVSPLGVGAECEAMRKALGLKSENALIRYAVCWVETGLGDG